MTEIEAYELNSYALLFAIYKMGKISIHKVIYFDCFKGDLII